jgi:hypothetical protein
LWISPAIQVHIRDVRDLTVEDTDMVKTMEGLGLDLLR